MKWPERADIRSSMRDPSPATCTNTTPVARSTSRYDRFSAEQVTTPCVPDARWSRIHAATTSSHGHRSSSSSGVPACIFATFAGGCMASPSAKSQPSRSATIAATVDLPEPETPITTSTRASSSRARLIGSVLIG